MRVASYPVVTAKIRMPAAGAWVATVELAGNEKLSGRVTMQGDFGGLSLTGTILDGEVSYDTFHATIIGGAGGLDKTVGPKFFSRVPLRVPLSDTLRAAGESLSSASSQRVTSKQVEAWTRMRGTCRETLIEIAEYAGVTWNVTATGEIWIGELAYPAASLPDIATLLDENAALRWRDYACDEIVLVPNVTLEGWKIGEVVHMIGEGGVRTRVYQAS